MITKRLTAPLLRKVKVPKLVYTPLLKLPFEAIISAKHVLITYTFVDNLPLTNIHVYITFKKFLILSNFFILYDILADNVT